MRLQQKWIPVLRENAARTKSARFVAMPILSLLSAFSSVPKRAPSCPATATKTTIPRAAGVIAPAAARAVRARRGGRTRSSPNAALSTRAMAASAGLMPQSPTAANPMTRSPIRVPANPMPASGRMAVRRAAILATVRRASTATTVRKATAHFGIARATWRTRTAPGVSPARRPRRRQASLYAARRSTELRPRRPRPAWRRPRRPSGLAVCRKEIQ